MKVYGVYRGTDEGWFLQTLWLNKSDARTEALRLVEIEKALTKEMQDHCGDPDYKDWEISATSKDRWDGDWMRSIAVNELEVIE